MASSLLLKSWLSDRLNDVNTARENVSLSAVTLDLNKTKATAAGAISDLVNLVSELSSNTYLKHSPLWSNGALDAPDAGEIIDDVKKA